MTDIAALKAKNAARWAAMKPDPARVPTFKSVATRLCAPEAKARFAAVTPRLVALGYQPVPWWFIAVVAEREYGGPPHWDKQLGQGDRLDQVSHNDPAGRGPFLGNDAWTRCALDALIDCAPHAAKWTDWSPGGAITILEEYNGLGYANKGVPSAYVWSGTDQYVTGKYVADHDYRAGVKDVQEGCAPLVACMMLLDSSIRFPNSPSIVTTPTPAEPVTPHTPHITGIIGLPNLFRGLFS